MNELQRVLLSREAVPSVVVLDGRTLRSTPESGHRVALARLDTLAALSRQEATSTIAAAWHYQHARETESTGMRAMLAQQVKKALAKLRASREQQ